MWNGEESTTPETPRNQHKQQSALEVEDNPSEVLRMLFPLTLLSVCLGRTPVHALGSTASSAWNICPCHARSTFADASFPCYQLQASSSKVKHAVQQECNAHQLVTPCPVCWLSPADPVHVSWGEVRILQDPIHSFQLVTACDSEHQSGAPPPLVITPHMHNVAF